MDDQESNGELEQLRSELARAQARLAEQLEELTATKSKQPSMES